MPPTPFERLLALPILAALCVAVQGAPADAQAGGVVPAVASAERMAAHAPELRVTDARLAAALELLVSASPTAARAVGAVVRGGLPVAIGTPAQLAALPHAAGGPGSDERRALLSASADGAGAEEEAAVAWVVFRASGGPRGAAAAEPRIERVWVAVEVDSVEAWIRRAGGPAVEARVRQDLLAILAHEFVAHVGSIAATRRIDDLCDDPTPAQRLRSAAARARGEAAPLDGEMAACALQVENRVRRELNRALRLRGGDALPVRQSYALDVMHFARARDEPRP